MVVAEARRTYTYLALFGYHVDAVVANRLLPAEIVDPWFKAWKEIQAEQLDEIEAAFAPVPVLTAELAAEELLGPDRLDAFAQTVYGARDPATRLQPTSSRSGSTPKGDALVLSMHLPFTEKHEVELGRRNGELLVAVGPHRRAVVLPDSLRRRDVGGARLEDDRLARRIRGGLMAMRDPGTPGRNPFFDHGPDADLGDLDLGPTSPADTFAAEVRRRVRSHRVARARGRRTRPLARAGGGRCGDPLGTLAGARRRAPGCAAGGDRAPGRRGARAGARGEDRRRRDRGGARGPTRASARRRPRPTRPTRPPATTHDPFATPEPPTSPHLGSAEDRSRVSDPAPRRRCRHRRHEGARRARRRDGRGARGASRRRRPTRGRRCVTRSSV